MPERCFVAGATGYTGRELVRVLCERAHTVVAHVRPDSARLAEWSERFTALGATVSTAAWEPAAMRAELTSLSPTQLYCTLGTTQRRARRDTSGRSDYAHVDIGLTRLLLEAAAELTPPPLFVYTSSIGVEPKPRGAYLLARREAEQAVRASGLPYILARPSVIHGPPRDEPRRFEAIGALAIGAFARLARATGKASTAARYAPVHPRALARALADRACDPGARDRALEGLELLGEPR